MSFNLTKGNIELIDNAKTKTRKPSPELLAMFKDCAKLGTKLATIFEKIKERASQEGFSEEETTNLFKDHLRGVLTARQIRWYFVEKPETNLKRQLELKQKEKENIQIRSQVQIQDAELVTETRSIPVDSTEIESIQDLRATVDTQQQYISTLEDKVQEKQEVARSQNQIRVKISVSQLYRDVLMMRNSNAIYTNILIDNNKYVKLEPV